MTRSTLLPCLLRGIHIGLICVAGWYTFILSMFWLGGPEDMQEICTGGCASFVGGRALWSLIVIKLSVALLVSVNLFVAWLFRRATAQHYPIRRLNLFALAYLTACGAAGFLLFVQALGDSS